MWASTVKSAAEHARKAHAPGTAENSVLVETPSKPVQDLPQTMTLETELSKLREENLITLSRLRTKATH